MKEGGNISARAAAGARDSETEIRVMFGDAEDWSFAPWINLSRVGCDLIMKVLKPRQRS